MATVLIVEDDLEIRNLYSFALTHAGYEVLQASNAMEGLGLLEEHRPDLVLLDMLMPGQSGLDLLKENNIRHRFPDMKLVVFSNIETPRVVQDAKALGVDAYFLKVNVTPHQMIDLVKELLAGKKTTQKPVD